MHSHKDIIMDEIHKIREDLFKQYNNSGLGFSEWLKSTEKSFEMSLAEVGFKIIDKNGTHYLVEK